MKYIRTKDGIMNISQTNTPYVIIDGEYRMISTFKQADNIEELCDEFIGVSNLLGTIDRFIITDMLSVKKPSERITFSGGIYGAIWYEFGLKYVAKMNDKGEWELL